MLLVVVVRLERLEQLVVPVLWVHSALLVGGPVVVVVVVVLELLAAVVVLLLLLERLVVHRLAEPVRVRCDDVCSGRLPSWSVVRGVGVGGLLWCVRSGVTLNDRESCSARACCSACFDFKACLNLSKSYVVCLLDISFERKHLCVG